MIVFDIAKLTVQQVWLKSGTTALGGSISVLDEDKSTKKSEVFKRIPVPMAIVRKFNAIHKTSKYLHPVLSAVTFYEGQAVALERHPAGMYGEQEFEGVFGKTKWVSNSESNIKNLKRMTASDDYLTDGTFVYSINAEDISCAHILSKSKKFRAVSAFAYKLGDLYKDDGIKFDDRTCLGYFLNEKKYVISSPIWKDIANVGTGQLSKGGHNDEDDETDTVFQFDKIDQYLAVNLNFGLKAGKEIGGTFGYEYIEPLNLPELMVDLQTVNIPQVAMSIKSSYDIGMQFTHTIAWLIGLTARCDNLEMYRTVRGLLKYVTTKGVFRKNMFDSRTVFRNNSQLSDVPFLTKEQAARVNITKHEMEHAIAIASNKGGIRRSVNSIGTLHDAI